MTFTLLMLVLLKRDSKIVCTIGTGFDNGIGGVATDQLDRRTIANTENNTMAPT